MRPNHSERRKHKRQKVNGSLIIYNDNMYAEIVDISKGGLSCRTRVSSQKVFAPVLEMELLDKTSGNFIGGLSGMMLRCSESVSQGDDKTDTILNFGIEFKDMTEEKRELLDRFINSSLISHIQPENQKEKIIFN